MIESYPFEHLAQMSDDAANDGENQVSTRRTAS
jgi:hypothetical protein